MKNHGRRILARELEKMLDLLNADAVILRAEIAAGNRNELGAAFACERLRKARLANARAADHKNAARCAHAHVGELLRVV
jgi:arginase family enzyme